MKLRELGLRRAPLLASVVLAMTVATAIVMLLLANEPDPPSWLTQMDLPYLICQILPYGVVGTVLVARRPDLPFGWILSLSATCLAVMMLVLVPAALAFQRGHGSQLALWALGFGSLAWVPTALEGVVNVRFPSGRPSGLVGRILDRALLWGIPVVVLAGLLSDWPLRELGVGTVSRFVDGTWVPPVANALLVGVPILILLGILAGVGVIIRCLRASGLERQQLQWRAGGVVVALVAFPFAVNESAPRWVALTGPLVFVTTLAIPVLRYDLWAIDSIVRRSAAYTLAAPGSAVTNLLRATGEMLHLPYVAVIRPTGVLASYGAPAGNVMSWPLLENDRQVAELVAAPRWGRDALDVQDAQILATLGELIGSAVRAEALNADLLDARHRLVVAREEERRRLRRDLHDGLGPLLTGLGLNLDAAASDLHRADGRSETYLSNARAASTEVISTVRELVHGLRPPALDEFGFVGAVRSQTTRIAADGDLRLALDVPDDLTLPAAVEVAALRAVVEATTNVVRHGRASAVSVSIHATEAALTIAVSDDGAPSEAWQPGVGLTSMRERAEELGGTVTAGPTGSGGHVVVTYPLGRMP